MDGVTPAALTDRDHWLYGKLIDAVERQVERGRADLQFFLVLNASVVAGALAMLQFLDKPQVAFLGFLAFAGGFGLAVAGVHVSRNNKKFYRTLVVKRVLMEEKLGLTDAIPGHERVSMAIFAVSALAAKEKVAEILADPEGYVRSAARMGSNTEWGRWALWAFALFHVVAAVVLADVLMGCALPLLPCAP